MSTSIDTNIDKELEILETIHTAKEEAKPVAQRDIAHIVGVSLGMTNAILKRLAKKGLLTIKKVNNRNIHYAVSPEGMRALSEKSYRYFKRTIKNVVYYKEKIGDVIESAADAGCTSVVLAGQSDLDFIVEHFCFKYGLEFRRVKADRAAETVRNDPGAGAAGNGAGGVFVVYSERELPPADALQPADTGQSAGIDGAEESDAAIYREKPYCYLRSIVG